MEMGILKSSCANTPRMRKERNGYSSLLLKSATQPTQRILIGIPMTGLLRSEWALARMGQIIPCNWSSSDYISWMNSCSPLGYAVAEARNVIVDRVVKEGFEWLLFIDHDVVLPPDAFVRINEYMLKPDYPVVSGLYYAKCHPPSPLLYRGRGNGHYTKWRHGDKVEVDGIPMGCTLIHSSLLKVMWDDAEEYMAGGNAKVRRVFDTPNGVYHNPQTGSVNTFSATEDIAWCNRVMAGGYLKKAGWTKIHKKKYPFLIDTGILCKHITMDGIAYPLL